MLPGEAEKLCAGCIEASIGGAKYYGKMPAEYAAVHNALAALVKRESATPSAEAANTSLGKVASRIESFRAKLVESHSAVKNSLVTAVQRCNEAESAKRSVVSNCMLKMCGDFGFMQSHALIKTKYAVNELPPTSESRRDIGVLAEVAHCNFAAGVAWCQEHPLSTSKFDKPLLLDLQAQHLVELVREGKSDEATSYFFHELAPQAKQNDDSHLKSLAALLCLSASSAKATKYEPYFHASKKETIQQRFVDLVLRHNAATSNGTEMETFIRVGALGFGYGNHTSRDADPLDHSSLSEVRQALPSVTRPTMFICEVTGKPADPPYVLDTGVVVSLKGLEIIRQQTHRHAPRCPRTGSVTDLQAVRKLLVV